MPGRIHKKEQLTMADTTKWACSVDPASKQASLSVATSGGPPQSIRIKGVCYSPAPLNGSNAYAPAIGDWFWDSFDGVTGWNALWARDLPVIGTAHLNANAIRVYCMLSRQLEPNGDYPDPWNSGQLFSHQNFLDACWNNGNDPIYVLAGIPLPAPMFWKDQYQTTPQAEITYWTSVLGETAQMLGQHPAVLGFTIQNEQDGADVCYKIPALADFWWSQVENMAKIVKDAAPDKLVGMATHDDPNIPFKAASYMAQCPSIDFWGVNTYQTQNFDSIFN